MLYAQSPHSIAAHSVPFRALAALAARLPMGGDREVALACFMSARLASAMIGAHAPTREARAERAAAARGWFAALALPAALRIPFARLVDATAGDDFGAVAGALAVVLETAAPHLDEPAQAELDGLVRELRG